jgi:hypothetical protein
LIGPIEDQEESGRTGFYEVNVGGQHVIAQFDDKKVAKAQSPGYFVRNRKIV